MNAIILQLNEMANMWHNILYFFIVLFVNGLLLLGVAFTDFPSILAGSKKPYIFFVFVIIASSSFALNAYIMYEIVIPYVEYLNSSSTAISLSTTSTSSGGAIFNLIGFVTLFDVYVALIGILVMVQVVVAYFAYKWRLKRAKK